MRLIDLYLAKQLFLALLMVVLLLFGLELFFSFIQEMKWVGRGSYTLSLALAYLLMVAPSKIYQLLPWAACLGTLLSLGALAENSELTVIRASGVSVNRIAISVLKTLFAFVTLAFLIGEGVAPYLEEYASGKRTSAISSGQTLETPYGVWTRHGTTFVHVQAVQPDGSLQGVTRYQFNSSRQLESVSLAEKAVPLDKKGWRLEKIKETRFLGDKTQVTQEAEATIEQLLEPDLIKNSGLKHPEYLSLTALWKNLQHRSQHGLDATAYWLAWWTKCLHPFAVVVMGFISIPFVFGRMRRSSFGQRLIIGFLLGFLFFTTNKTFAPLAVVYQAPPFLAVSLPIILFSGLGIYLIQRMRYR